ncbi:MAG: hypothetical protein WAN71_01515 [Mycobacterium sp.]|uniref:hypothetical protein n=1 Tax=Mycobacterium sp. TaxID=1785 RepID=UPI003BB1DCC4
MTSASPDFEVGRYGLRTFRVDRNARALLPVVREDRDAWAGGVCVARCAHGHTHSPPGEGCNCGVYAATSLGSLLGQYPRNASNIVAVIAAEGPTIIGSSGLRTSAARVVAYWCHPSPRLGTARAVLAQQCRDAKAYDDCGAMLAAHHMPLGLDQFAAGQYSSWIGDIYPGGADASSGIFDRLTSRICYLFILPAVTAYMLATLGVGRVETAVETVITSTRGPVALAALASTGATLRIGQILLSLVLGARGRRLSDALGWWGVKTAEACIGVAVFLVAYAARSGPVVPLQLAETIVVAGLALAAPYVVTGVATAFRMLAIRRSARLRRRGVSQTT